MGQKIFDLAGQVALITGGGGRGNIGRALSKGLAEFGCDIVVVDAKAEYQEEIVSEIEALGRKCLFFEADVTDSKSINAVVEETISHFGKIDVLVNSAGTNFRRPAAEYTEQEWDFILDTNLKGVFLPIQAVGKTMIERRKGKIINVASIHGVRGEFGLANYISSKAGVIGLTRSAAVELGPSNVNVNAVAPGYIRTTRLTDQVPAEILDRAREKSLLGRLGDPQDVARVVLFLCSEAARHITGAVIPVDGGYLL